jgi:hypothetical protein
MSSSYVQGMVKPPSFLSALSILSSLKYRKQLSGPYILEIRSLIKQKIQILLKSCLLIAVIVYVFMMFPGSLIK